MNRRMLRHLKELPEPMKRQILTCYAGILATCELDHDVLGAVAQNRRLRDLAQQLEVPLPTVEDICLNEQMRVRQNPEAAEEYRRLGIS